MVVILFLGHSVTGGLPPRESKTHVTRGRTLPSLFLMRMGALVEEFPYVSVGDVMQKANVALKTVHYHIMRGHLKATKVGGRYLIKREDLDEYLRKHGDTAARRSFGARYLMGNTSDAQG
jgi:excisionase family DNA binding protein